MQSRLNVLKRAGGWNPGLYLKIEKRMDQGRMLTRF